MGYGHVLAREATEWGISRAHASGMAVVALRRSYHLARLGTYGEMAAAAAWWRSSSSTWLPDARRWRRSPAPTGACRPTRSASPCRRAKARLPIILDFATSRIALGKVRVAFNEGRPVRPGTLVDATGAPTTEAGVMFTQPVGALLSFGEHKGSGLALMCELLAGALIGGPANDRLSPPPTGVINNLFGIIVDPARLGELPVFRHEVDAVVAHLKASPPADRDQPVMVAGEPEARSRASRIAGGIPIDETSWQEILAAAGKVGAPVDYRVRIAS